MEERAIDWQQKRYGYLQMVVYVNTGFTFAFSPSLGADPQFQTLKIFDATVFEDVPNVESGLPVVGAILLHKEKAMQVYTFTTFKADIRA